MKLGELKVALLDQSKTDAAMGQLEQEKQVAMVTHMCMPHLSTNVLIHTLKVNKEMLQ